MSIPIAFLTASKVTNCAYKLIGVFLVIFVTENIHIYVTEKTPKYFSAKTIKFYRHKVKIIFLVSRR
jgi:hypothetical protein